MKETIQHLLMPSEELRDSSKLFFRSDSGIVKESKGTRYLVFPDLVSVDFLTYFNSVSIEKWRMYTKLTNLTLKLDIKGQFSVIIVGASLELQNPTKTILTKEYFSLDTRTEIRIDIPESDDMLVGFLIDTESVVELYSGDYLAEFPNERVVNLSLCTTTMRKEEYIKRNVRTLYGTLLESGKEIAEHLYVHIVDNGRTLSEGDFPVHEHIFLHVNKNVGGAGGFARGMIESLEQPEDITHVLLMDDDVRIEPDSIFRTYILLKHLLPQYYNYFISGAMLHLEDPSIQQEDVGFVNEKGYFIPLKPRFNQEKLENILQCSKEYKRLPNSYAAWWYCCIPMDTISEYGLPVPVFVRGDDVEYGLRCQPEFITMNGICVWHLGFVGKFNTAMDFYQVNRNLLINRALGELKGVDVFKKNHDECRGFLLRFDYDTAELIIRAMEDYLKGPEFIMEDRGEEILKSNMKLVHKMQSMNDFGSPDADEPEKNMYIDIKMPKWKHYLYVITLNGHRWWPFRYNERPMLVSYDLAYTPNRYTFRNTLYGFNRFNRTGYELKRDNKRFKELWKRFVKADRECRAKDEPLSKRYREAHNTIQSQAFWKKYLEI